MAARPAKLFQGTPYVCVNKLTEARFHLCRHLSHYLSLSILTGPFSALPAMLVIGRPVTDGKEKIHKQLPLLRLFTASIQPSRPSSQNKLAVKFISNQILLVFNGKMVTPQTNETPFGLECDSLHRLPHPHNTVMCLLPLGFESDSDI